MTPELWKQVKELFRMALDLTPDRRAAFLDEVCLGNELLRKEIESLLAAHEASDKLVEKPVYEVVAEMMAQDQTGSIVGHSIGPYKIISKLGAGGMGEVYRAKDSRLDRDVAIKVLPEHLAKDIRALARFEREARALATLSHPNILTLHDFGNDKGVSFAVMELLQGKTLSAEIEPSGMHWNKALEIALPIAEGLNAAHSKGVIHRDLKPENIFLTSTGGIKILDFGLVRLAKVSLQDVKDQNSIPSEQKLETDPNKRLAQTKSLSVDTDQTQSSVETIRKEAQPQVSLNGRAMEADQELLSIKKMVETMPGALMGTVPYMSPEQLAGNDIDTRTDIFSFGSMLYEMLTGSNPFHRNTRSETMMAILNEQPPKPADKNKEIPQELERLVMSCLEKDKNRRVQSASELALALRTILVKSRALPWYQSRAAWTVAGSLLATILTAIVIFLYSGHNQPIDSIAVLPFVNASDDPNTEYISDGITETLINNLSQLQKLRVIARTTAFRYKGKNVDPQNAGRELGVRAVMTGRVMEQGENLNVQVDLVDVDGGSQIWGEHYDRKISDLARIQKDISQEITEKLRLKLSGQEKKALSKGGSKNSKAYQAYLKGQFYWNKRSSEGVKKAIEQFQQAIDIDPNYALAYVGLADCYNSLAEYVGIPTSETLPKAEAATERALEIDDSLAEAHTSLAFVYENRWQWKEAENEYRRSISLNPNYSTAHHWYSLLLACLKRFDEAEAEIKRAQELDPLSPMVNTNIATEVYIVKGDFESAVEQYKKALEIDEKFPQAHRYLAYVYSRQRRYDEALAEAEKAVESSGRASEFLSMQGYCYAVAGKYPEALAVVAELEQKYSKKESLGAHLACVYFVLGDKDKAFSLLEKDFEAGSAELQFIVWDLPYAPLFGNDPRYGELVRRMGLP